jgi:hypothetical protein
MLFLCALGATLTTWIALRQRRILAAERRSAAAYSDAATALEGSPWSPPAAAARPRPRLADIGLSPLGVRLAALNAMVLAVDVWLFSMNGLTLDWSSTRVGALLLGTLLIVWLTFYVLPGPPADRFVAEAVFVVLLLVLATNVASPLQYGAIALGSPYADPWLAAADAWMGIHVPDSAAWIRARPVVSLLANAVYFSLLPQFLFAVVVLAVLRERERLWEFAFHFQGCLVVTVAALAIWPAACAPVYYGFTPAIDITRAMDQIKGLHDGTMTVIRFDQLEGLVSIPSFHAAGGLLVTWAFRDRRWILLPLIVLNVGLILATFLTGIHYAVDIVAALPLLAASFAAWRWWARPLLTPCGAGDANG